ncbi:Hypothetical predicted protein, partial [Paramuricea clavata]
KNEDFDHESETEGEFLEPVEKKSKSQVKQDEIIARELQSQFNNECNDTINITSENEDASIATENEVLVQLAEETTCSTAVLSEDDQRNADLKETPEENRNYQNIVDIVKDLPRKLINLNSSFLLSGGEALYNAN